MNLRAERALSDFNTAHRFVFTSLYDLPFGPGQRWLSDSGLRSHLLGSWQLGGILALQTGHPFTVNLGTAATGTSITTFGIPNRPDLVGDPSRPGPVAANPGCQAPGLLHTPQSWFNPCAFSDQFTGRFGTAGRNILTAPGYNNLDFSLLKSIPLRGEGHALQLRAEFFNLFNHPNFDAPSRTFNSATFGSLLSANAWGNKPPRQIQMAVRYTF